VDTSFVFSQWQKGIESWRFNQPTDFQPQPEVRAHTVFDRTLLRAGETVSMKHFVRTETTQGLALVDAAELPARVRIVHQGTGQEYTQPLSWNGQRSATSTWTIPAAAKLGAYSVSLERDASAGSPLTDARREASPAATSASRSSACRWSTRASRVRRTCRSRRGSFRSTFN
jgi:uncharacterized protein YfaS (alpha-2-macroglobulin family)